MEPILREIYGGAKGGGKTFLQEKMRDLLKDAERLDFLQELNNQKAYTGRCILRMSGTGRGWRLHESSNLGSQSVRDAIDYFMTHCGEVDERSWCNYCSEWTIHTPIPDNILRCEECHNDKRRN